MERIGFNGIVRSMAVAAGQDGNCAEVVNMRPDKGVWRAVGRKERVAAGTGFADVFVHEFEGRSVYWGKAEEGERCVWRRFDPATGSLTPGKAEIVAGHGDGLFGTRNFLITEGEGRRVFLYDFAADDYRETGMFPLPRFTCAKQQQVNAQSGIIEFTLAGLRPADFLGGTYVEYAPENEPDREEKAEEKEEWTKISFREGQLKDMMGALTGAYREVAGRSSGYVQGRVFVCAAYELFDGSVVNYTPPVLVTLGDAFRRDLFRCLRQDYDGEDNVKEDNTNVASLFLKFRAQECRVEKLKITPGGGFGEHRGLIRRMNVYMTDVVDVYDTGRQDARHLYFVKNRKKYNLVHTAENRDALPELKLTEQVVAGLQFYRVLQFSAEEAERGEQKEVPFGAVTANPLMPVDPMGWFERSGRMFRYNRRVHMFDYRDTFTRPTFDFSSLYNTAGGIPADVYTYIRTGTEDVVVKSACRVGANTVAVPLMGVFAFPDARAYRSVWRSFYDGVYCESVFAMKPSDRHNFSFLFASGGAVRTSRDPFPDIPACYSLANRDNLTVCRANNPLYYDAGNVYRMDGDILHLAVATEQISGSQVGQFPLYVFTTEGIYALQSGDGTVLYGNVVPVSVEVAQGRNVLQTRHGIVFAADNGLKLISGREVVCLSDPVDGDPDAAIRACGAYRVATGHEWLCDVGRYLSTAVFREYARAAVMGYNAAEDEVIVSNAAYGYSYVCSLKEGRWYKVTEVFTRFSRHLGIRVAPGGGTEVCDLRRETPGTVATLVQTRPLKLGSSGFKLLRHTVFRGDFEPGGGKYMGFYLFVSDDLAHWHIAAASQKNDSCGSALLGRAARSGRYFVLVAAGEAYTGHMLSHAEVEAEEKFGRRLR